MKTHLFKRAGAAGCAVLTGTVCLAALPQIPALAAGAVVINEVCTKNTVLPAANGAFYDYVELYNPGSSAVSLAGWGLSDDAALPFAYTFPADSTVPAKGWLTVWCGVTDSSGAAFGLSKKGETVFLTNASGELVEQLEVPALADNTAFGRIPDGSDTFGVLETLSAGQPNPTDSVSQIAVQAPAFSQESGFYQNEFSLTLQAAPGCTIYYTTDGSDPTTNSPKYTEPIRIYDRSGEANVYAAETDIADSYNPPTDPVDKAMIIRAAAADANGNISKIITKTYFIGYGSDSMISNMRVISLVTDPDNLFDYEKGIYVWGKVHDDWRQSSEYNSRMNVWEQPANFTQSGREWERPAHITVFEGGSTAYTAEVGLRIHGGATRVASQKSFNLYARADYGDTKLRYDFFGGNLCDTAGTPITEFDKIMLRNGGNDKTIKLRDRINQEAVQDRSFGTQAQTECLVFLDGEFWGAYNITEKIGKEYISDHFGVKEKDVCMIKTDELSDGSAQGYADYEALKNLAETMDYASESAYAELAEKMDLQNFADYMAAELILGNSDFGNNNYALWKTETVDSGREFADGKWRFLLFDTEYGQGLYGQSDANTSTFNSLREKDTWLTKLFFGLLDHNETFRQQFALTYFDLCNENYSAANMTARVDAARTIYTNPDIATYDRFETSAGNGWGWGWGWGQQQDASSTVRSEIDTVRTFWESRDQAAKRQLLSALSLGQTFSLTLQNPADQGNIALNTLSLDCADGDWSGTYPEAYPITLEAQPKPGYTFSHWEISGAELTSGSEHSASISLKNTAQTVSVKAVYEEGSAPLTAADAQKLMQYLLAQTTLTQSEAQRYDLDGSGKLDAADLTALKRKLNK